MSELHGRLRGTSVSAYPQQENQFDATARVPSYSERIHRRIKFLEDDLGASSSSPMSDANGDAEERKRLASAVVAANVWMRKTKESKAKARQGETKAAVTASPPPEPRIAVVAEKAIAKAAAATPPRKATPKTAMVAETVKEKTRPVEKTTTTTTRAKIQDSAAMTVHAVATDEEENVVRGAHDPFMNRYRRESVTLQNEKYTHFDIKAFTSSVDGALRSSDRTLDEMTAWMERKREREAAAATSERKAAMERASGPPSPSTLNFLEDSLTRFEKWSPSPATKNGYVVAHDSPLQQRYLEHQRHREETRRLDARVSDFSRSAAAAVSPLHSPYSMPRMSPMHSPPSLQKIQMYSPPPPPTSSPFAGGGTRLYY